MYVYICMYIYIERERDRERQRETERERQRERRERVNTKVCSDISEQTTARSRVSISRLKAELCFHRYVHFACVPIYGFGFHHKQCASN